MTTLFFLAAALVQQPPATPYFQQEVAHVIEARLDETTDVLSGRMRLHYRNRSPATLDSLYFHLELNAFRPNSAWAQRELQFDERRFQDLSADEHAFERLRSVRVNGSAVQPHFRGVPDSTVVAVALPRPLAPGDSVSVVIDWDARLSTLPRRQGRRGRHHDFAQWYPRIAVYDHTGWATRPLLPQGEFYGEYGTFDVTLDLAEDQVVAATGVPISGEPGWAAAKASSSPDPDYQRDAYGNVGRAPALGFLPATAERGRKRIRWHARDVHHFAWSTDPDYIYEGGRVGDTPIHVLYQPGDTAWDNGVVVERTAEAIRFFEDLFGPYVWPQITNLHRIESGGTEFPMMIMDGSASEGLIVHEIAHQWVHGIFGNNEWREGWLDEGFDSFVSSWYAESKGALNPFGGMNTVAEFDATGRSQPLAMASADFRDFQTYNLMTYGKPALVLRMLRELIGEDAMRRGLRHFYDTKKLQHVTEADLIASLEAGSGTDLDWFFQQWFHTTGTLDYRVGNVDIAQVDGGFRVRVDVIRDGENFMPVQLQVGDHITTLNSTERTQIIEVTVPTRPAEIVLDPRVVLIDINRGNNRWTP